MKRIPAAVIIALAVARSASAQEWDGNRVYCDSASFRAEAVDTTTVAFTWLSAECMNVYDGYYGPVDSYELRCSTVSITSFDQAAPVAAILPESPADPYKPERGTATGLQHNTTYWFALRATRGMGPPFPGYADYRILQVKTAADLVGPASISTLAVSPASNSTITLTWIAVGDDGESTGRAANYDLRYSTAGPITTTDLFAAASPVVFSRSPGFPGTKETAAISQLAKSTRYWVAIQAIDEVGNRSPLGQVSPFADTLDEDDINHGAGDLPCGGGAAGRAILPGFPLLLLLVLGASGATPAAGSRRSA